MAGFLAEKGLRILRNGYNVIPIKPGEKAPGIKDWTTIKTTPRHVKGWLANGYADSGVGITTGEVVFIDLDIFDTELVMALQWWIMVEIGTAPVRIGNAPKRGLVFRTETPFHYMASRAYIDSEGRKAQVEVASLGRQFVAYHIHPDTGRPYAWGVDEGPELSPSYELISVSEDECRSIIREFERMAAEKGWKTKKSEPTVRPDDDDDEMGLNTDPVGFSEDQIRETLMSIPNDLDERGDWINIGFSVHHETGGSDFGREVFYEWSAQHSSHNDALFEKAWNSFGKADASRRQTTFRYVIKLARAFKAAKRPTIRIRSGELHAVATEAETSLLDFGAPLYSRGAQIVRPIVEETEASKGRRTNIARLTAVSIDSLTDWMSRAANWVRFDVRAKKDVPADPPRAVASVLASRDGEWRLRPLAGVLTTPTLRPDGSLLAEAGYDSETKLLLLDPPQVDVPDKPTRRHAERALAKLADLITEFPFVDEPSKSVALSALISPVVRGAMSVLPMHVARAPTAGSGKSYIMDIAAAIAIGQRCPVISAGKTEEETEKRLGALLIAGQMLISIDNLNGELNGDFLCQAVERPLLGVRILGRSEVVQIENRSCIFATGNNIIVKGDMLRRSMVCSLDPNLERPELRQFHQNPFERVLADRSNYVAAALIIIRAYIEAGRPGRLRPALASFEDWSDTVRSALVWLGCVDPVQTLERARDEDPEISTATQIFETWYETIGVDKRLTVAEIINIAQDNNFDDTRFAEALSSISRDGSSISPFGLGMWLKRNKGRVLGPLKINGGMDSHKKIARWWLSFEIDL